MKFKDNSLSGIIRSLVADEFLAWTSYYFYEIISQGKALNYTNKIFEENGKDELEDHYHKLVNWMQSNHIPVPTGLGEMQEICNTQYNALHDPTNTSELVDQMIIAEIEAIDAYTQAMKEPAVLEYPDLVTMLGEICIDEREHLKNLEDVKSNIDKYGMRISNFNERIHKCFSNIYDPWYVDYRDEDGFNTDEFKDKTSAQEFIDHNEDYAQKHAAEGAKFDLVKGPYQK